MSDDKRKAIYIIPKGKKVLSVEVQNYTEAESDISVKRTMERNMLKYSLQVIKRYSIVKFLKWRNSRSLEVPEMGELNGEYLYDCLRTNVVLLEQLTIGELRRQFEAYIHVEFGAGNTGRFIDYTNEYINSQWLGYVMCARSNNLIKDGE